MMYRMRESDHLDEQLIPQKFAHPFGPGDGYVL